MLRNSKMMFCALALGLSAPANASEQGGANPQAVAAVDALWPDGTTEMMMEQMAGPMTDAIFGSISSMSSDSILEMVRPMAEDDAALEEMERQLAGKSMGELMVIIDPHFEERQRISMRIMFDAMGPVMADAEPMMKARLAEAFDRQYSDAELAAANQFFATPEGRGFAAKFMAVYMDPEYLGTMSELTPALMEVMPRAVADIRKATGHLPPPGEDAEERLFKALGGEAAE